MLLHTYPIPNPPISNQNITIQYTIHTFSTTVTSSYLVSRIYRNRLTNSIKYFRQKSSPLRLSHHPSATVTHCVDTPPFQATAKCAFLCHLLDIKHSHWTPASVMHTATDCGATVRYFQGSVQVQRGGPRGSKVAAPCTEFTVRKFGSLLMGNTVIKVVKC